MKHLLILSILSLGLVSCDFSMRVSTKDEECKHCPDGQIQRISRIPKKKFYKNYYSSPAKEKPQEYQG